jgi:hypothetical protein
MVDDNKSQCLLLMRSGGSAVFSAERNQHQAAQRYENHEDHRGIDNSGPRFAGIAALVKASAAFGFRTDLVQIRGGRIMSTFFDAFTRFDRHATIAGCT